MVLEKIFSIVRHIYSKFLLLSTFQGRGPSYKDTLIPGTHERFMLSLVEIDHYHLQLSCVLRRFGNIPAMAATNKWFRRK